MTQQYEDVDSPTIAVVGFIGAVVMFALVVLLLVVFYNVQSRRQAEAIRDQPPSEWANLVSGQQAQLASYRWIDEKKGIVAIPIGRAEELVLAELAEKGRGQPAGVPPGEWVLPRSGVVADPIAHPPEPQGTRPAGAIPAVREEDNHGLRQ
jgi:hypothetical protein